MLLTTAAYTLFILGLAFSGRLAGESFVRLRAGAGIARPPAVASRPKEAPPSEMFRSPCAPLVDNCVLRGARIL